LITFSVVFSVDITNALIDHLTFAALAAVGISVLAQARSTILSRACNTWVVPASISTHNFVFSV
jgi:hypothetical protein